MMMEALKQLEELWLYKEKNSALNIISNKMQLDNIIH